MTLFAADRLELLMAHLHAELSKLKELKAKRKKGQRQKRSARRAEGVEATKQAASKSPDAGAQKPPHDELLGATSPPQEDLTYKQSKPKQRLPHVPQLDAEKSKDVKNKSAVNIKENDVEPQWY